jgi:hypothetical protein
VASQMSAPIVMTFVRLSNTFGVEKLPSSSYTLAV